MTKEDIKKFVMKPIKDAGFDIYFVGGCVRDSLIGKEPHDFDLATNATPEELHTVFNTFSSQNSEPFGVTMPIIKGELIEVATMRKDITKGRHPKIEFTKEIKEDAARRDFTVNALYEDIDGNIIDPNGTGREDISKMCLRFIGNAVDRVSEDPLRLFRFCRFMAQKGFTPSEEDSVLEESLSKFVNDIGVETLFKDVSKERMLKEIVGIFGGKHFMTESDRTLYFMERFGILEAIGLKEIFDEMKETTQNPMWHAEGGIFDVSYDGEITEMDGKKVSELFKKFLDGKGQEPKIVNVKKYGSVYDHTILVMKEMAKKEHDWLDMMGAALHDAGKPVSARRKEKKNPTDGFYRVKDHPITGIEPTEKFCKNLNMSNADTDVLKELVLRHMEMHHLFKIKSKYSVLKLVKNPVFDRLVKLAICDSDGCMKTAIEEEQKSMQETLEMPKIKACIEMEFPKPILNGDYIIEKGYKPGPLFKKALETAHKVQIDQDITDPERLFRQVKGILKSN